MRRTGVILAFVFLLSPLMSSGTPIASDRPKQAQSSSVVDPGVVQIEAGYRYADDDEARLERSTFGNVLVRIGMVPNVELRAGWDGYVYQERSTGKVKDGIGDAEIGSKVYLCPEEGARPELAVLGELNLPLGADGISSDEADPVILLLASQSLSEFSTLHYNLGIRWEKRDDTDSYLAYAVAWAYRLYPEVTAYAELFGDIGVGDAEDRHSFDIGLTYDYSHGLAFDAFIGAGFSDDAEDVIAGFGATIRLP